MRSFFIFHYMVQSYILTIIRWNTGIIPITMLHDFLFMVYDLSKVSLEENCLLGWDTVLFGRNILMFLMWHFDQASLEKYCLLGWDTVKSGTNLLMSWKQHLPQSTVIIEAPWSSNSTENCYHITYIQQSLQELHISLHEPGFSYV